MATILQPLSSEPKPQPAVVSPLRKHLAERIGLLDRVLAMLIVVFAFLVASFPARNSDFWLHAASGRLLAQGQYVFGADPFSFTTEGVYWTNHSWLCDLLFYALYAVPEIGGSAVVIFKALLVAALAAVLLQASRRPGQSCWIPSACVALAVLVFSPRLLLQSVCVSFLFLGLTLWILQKPLHKTEPSAAHWRSYWLLPPLFFLWVNLDEWFLLGPATVALYLLSELLHRCSLHPPADAKRAVPGQLRTLAVVLLAGVAACLFNPHHVHAFALPWELGLTPAAEALAQDRDFRYLFGSPLQELFLQSSTGVNIAALAYIPLLVAGVISFVLSWGMWRWWRVLVWLAFLALSLLSYRAVPFFAIVSAPILSLNCLDFASRRYGTQLPVQNVGVLWSLSGRAVSILIGFVLLIATFAGWLQPASAHRQVGWDVAVDPSLRQSALQIRAWREQGLIAADARLFNTMPDVAFYLAWFCPGERSFLDLRLPLFAEAAGDFVSVRDALAARQPDRPDEPWALGRNRAWRSIFRKWNIRFLIFNTRDPRLEGSQLVAQRLMLKPDGWQDEWTLCYLDGRTLIAGWKDHDRDNSTDPFAALRWNPDRLAFGPPATPSSEPVSASSSLSADEAFLHALHFRIMGPRWLEQNRQAWEASVAASLSGCTAAPGGPLLNGALLRSRIDYTYRVLHGELIAPRGTPPQPIDRLAEQLLSNHLAAQDSGPPASLYLALRAARRALLQNPRDAATYLLLGEVYLRLAWKTREHLCGRLLPHLTLIRQTQAAAALEQAVQLNPNLERAHDLLVQLYENAVQVPIPQPGRPWSEQLLHRPNWESALKHRREQVRCLRADGPRPGELAETYNRRVESLEKAVQQLADTVAKRADQWEVLPQNKPRLVRAQLALEQGLIETALGVLRQADSDEAFTGPQRSVARQWTVELLLGMGRLDEARAMLTPENPSALGMLPQPVNLPAAEWFRIQLASADGDYAEADQRLAAMLAAPKARGVTPSALLAQTIGHQLLWDAPLAAGMPWQVVRTSPVLLGLPSSRKATVVRGLEQSLLLLQQETDLLALRGWLALEQGDTRTARQCLFQVLECCREGERGLTLRAGPLALLYGDWLKANE